MQSAYDFVVIGAGSGGVRAARVAASLGAKVAIVERAAVGGTCVNAGCVPKKLLMYGSHFAEAFEDSRGFGWELGNKPNFSWSTLIANKDREINRLNQIYTDLLHRAGVSLFHGSARFVSPHAVQVGSELLKANKFLIAVGGRPVIPDIEGAPLAITSDEAFHLKDFPRSIVIVGAGYIGCEFAGIFQGLGAQVTWVFRSRSVLNGFDDTLRCLLQQSMSDRGVALQPEQEVVSIRKEVHGLVALLSSGQEVECDCVLFATGRKASTETLGLDSANVQVDPSGAVVVNDLYCSNQEHIYAIGDVTDHINLTPVALAQGMFVAQQLFGKKPSMTDLSNVPTAVFSQPQLATVGLTEAQARHFYGAQVSVFESQFTPLKGTLSGRKQKSLVKLVVHKGDQRVLGCHMLGEDAAETVQALAVALKAGATKAHFDATIGIHPTVAEEFVTLRTEQV